MPFGVRSSYAAPGGAPILARLCRLTRGAAACFLRLAEKQSFSAHRTAQPDLKLGAYGCERFVAFRVFRAHRQYSE